LTDSDENHQLRELRSGETEIDLKFVFGVLWGGQKLICGVTIAATVVAAIVASIEGKDVIVRNGDALNITQKFQCVRIVVVFMS